jgi:hypothetical protein
MALLAGWLSSEPDRRKYSGAGGNWYWWHPRVGFAAPQTQLLIRGGHGGGDVGEAEQPRYPHVGLVQQLRLGRAPTPGRVPMGGQQVDGRVHGLLNGCSA